MINKTQIYSSIKRATAFLLAFILTSGYLPFNFLNLNTPVEVEAQALPNTYVQPFIVDTTIYTSRYNYSLDRDGRVWASDCSLTDPTFKAAYGAGDAKFGQQEITSIEKSIKKIDGAGFGAAAISKDGKTLYMMGYDFTGGLATRIAGSGTDGSYNNTSIYQYDFYDKKGWYIVDVAAGQNNLLLVDSNGDIWNVNPSGNATWDQVGKGITKLPDYTPVGLTSRQGKFVQVELSDYSGGGNGTAIATTDKGEIYFWGMKWTPTTVPLLYGINNYTLGCPIKMDTSLIAAAEGAPMDGTTIVGLASNILGAHMLTKSGKIFYVGFTGGKFAISGLGNNYKIYDNSTFYAKTGVAGGTSIEAWNAAGSSEEIWVMKPVQLFDGYDYGTAAGNTTDAYLNKGKISSTKFVSIGASASTVIAVDENGKTYIMDSDSSLNGNMLFSSAKRNAFVEFKPTIVADKFNGAATDIPSKIIEAEPEGGLYATYITEDGKAYMSVNTNVSDTYGLPGGALTKEAIYKYITYSPVFNGYSATNVANKDITAETGMTSVVNTDQRSYSAYGSDNSTLNPKTTLQVKMSAGSVTGTNTVLSMANAGSTMKYVAISPSNGSTFEGKTYYEIAAASLDQSLLPDFAKDSSVVVPTAISKAMFNAVYNDPSFSDKGTMTLVSGTDDTVWETTSHISENAIVLVLASTTNGGFTYNNVMAFPIDNYYRQTKSYYDGVGVTNEFAGKLQLFSNKIVPGQYGAFVDEYDNTIYTDGIGDNSVGKVYMPPNGIDSTPDLSTYSGGTYLRDKNYLGDVINYWSLVPNGFESGYTNSQNITIDLTSKTLTDFNSIKDDNKLTYIYQKSDQWKAGKVIFVDSVGNDISNKVNQSVVGTLLPDGFGGDNSKLWPDADGQYYSVSKNAFTVAPLDTATFAETAGMEVVGYKIGSAPGASGTDYIPNDFSYNPLTGDFSFNPSIPTGNSSPATDLYIVFKGGFTKAYESYANADAYALANKKPGNWTGVTATVTAAPMTMTATTSASAVTTSGAAVQMGFVPTKAITAIPAGFVNINRIDGTAAGGGSAYDTDTYKKRVVGTSNGSDVEYKKPYTTIPKQMLIGYFDETGKFNHTWSATEQDFTKAPDSVVIKNMSADQEIKLVYLTDANYNNIPDVYEGYVEEKWVAVTANGTKVVMNRKFTVGYQSTTSTKTYTSYETNFDPGVNWIYKETGLATGGVEATTNGNKTVAGLTYNTMPTYANGKYSYAGTPNFKTVTYYYNEDSNENKVIDIIEPIKITVRGVDEHGKELYTWPLQSSFADNSFDVSAMYMPTYATESAPTLNAAASATGVVTNISNGKVTINPNKTDPNGGEASRNIIITFNYVKTITKLTIKQFNIADPSTPIGENVVYVDYTQSYNATVPAAKGFTFNQATTLDPSGISGYNSNAIPEYNAGKFTFRNIAKDGSSEVHLYYSKDSGNITIYAVDLDTLSDPIVIGSTTNRVVANGGNFDPYATTSYPKDFEIPLIANYSLKDDTGTPSFDIKGTVPATVQNFDGTNQLKAVYYFYTRQNASIISQAVLESDETTPILDINGAAIADIYDARVGETETVAAPVNSGLRKYVLVGLIDASGNRIENGTSTSVYVKDSNQQTVIKFLYRPLEPRTIKNITYVDRDNDGEYSTGDYTISERTLNMYESEDIDVGAPDILGYTFKESYVYDADGNATVAKSPSRTVTIDSERDSEVYFRYELDESVVTITAKDTKGNDISAKIPTGKETVKVTNGLEAIVYAPHIPGYVLTGVDSQNLGVVTGDTTTAPFIYSSIEEVAETYMAKITVRGLDYADNSEIYKYEVLASKGKDYTATAINVPNYKVLDGSFNEVPSYSGTVNVAYNEATETLDFYYKSQKMVVTAYYWDEENNKFIGTSQEVQNAIVGNPITTTAAYQGDYIYTGYSLTKPTDTSVADVDSTIGKIDSVDQNNKSIYFYYKPLSATDNIKVYHVEYENTFDGSLATAKTLKIFKITADSVPTTNGTTKDVSALGTIELNALGYDPTSIKDTDGSDNGTQTVMYSTGTNSYEVYFAYKKRTADVTIRADLYEADGTTLIEADKIVEVKYNQRVNESYVVNPSYVNGYYTNDSPISIIVDVANAGNVVDFKYMKYPQQTVTVIAKETDTSGQVLSSYTITGDIGAPVTLKPPKLIGWKLINPADDTVDKTHYIKATPDTIEYYYKKDETILNIKLVDDKGVDISSKAVVGTETSFKVPSSNPDLGYELSYRVYAPNIPGYVLVTPGDLYHDFDDTNKGTAYPFVYKSLDDIGSNYMAEVRVVGREKTTGDELYYYDTWIPLNTSTDFTSLEAQYYVLTTGEQATKTITPTRTDDINIGKAGVQLTDIVFEYDSILGEVTIVRLNETSGTPIQIGTDEVRRDAVLGEAYSVVADIQDSNLVYLGYSTTGNLADVVKVNGKPTTIAKIDPIVAGGQKVYFHYKEVTAGVIVVYKEKLGNGTYRNVSTVYVGDPVDGNYTIDGDGPNVQGTWSDAEDLTKYLSEDYYSITTDANYPATTKNITVDHSTGNAQIVEFLVKKETRTVRVQLYKDSAYTDKVVEDGAYEDITCRVGEFTTLVGPNSVNYVSKTKRKNRYIPSVIEVPSNIDGVYEVPFEAVLRTAHTTVVNYYDQDTSEVFNTYTMQLLDGQQVALTPQNQLGWKVVTSGAGINIVGGSTPVVNVPYKLNMQTIEVRYTYNGVDIESGLVDIFKAPVYDSAVNPNFYSDTLVSARSFEDYVLVSSQSPTKTFLPTDYKSTTTPITYEFKYIKITEMLDKYTVKVNVKGIDEETNFALYEYTLTLPENTIKDTEIKLQAVPNGYIYKDVSVSGGNILGSDYSQDADSKAITLKRTNDSTLGAIDVTFTYAKADGGIVNILAIDTNGNELLITQSLEVDLGTKVTGTAPKIKGYTLTSAPNSTLKAQKAVTPIDKAEVVVDKPETEIKFYYIADATSGSATINFIANGTTIDTKNVHGLDSITKNNYFLPETVVYNDKIYELQSGFSQPLEITAGGTYDVPYTYLKPATETITVTGPSTGGGGSGGGGGTKIIEVEKKVEVPVIVEVTKERKIIPVTNGSLELFSPNPYAIGYPDGEFKPGRSVTRAEVASMFYNLATDPNKEKAVSGKYSDVKDGDWYAKAINYLSSQGILKGYPDGEFKPNDEITRAEFAAISSRFDELVSGEAANFPDVPKTHWAYKAINSAYVRGWIGGYPTGEFKPESHITRAETVRIINCMIGRANKTIYTQEDNQFTDVNMVHWAFQEIMEATVNYKKVKK